jgi:hypothetical protein
MNKMTYQRIKDALKVINTDRLKDIIIKSEKDNREYGLKFCDNGHITATDVCAGSSCTLDIESCKDKKTIGSFHTHPRGDPAEENIYYNTISAADIRHSIYSNEEFHCLGLIQDEKPTIKCYLPYYGVKKDIALNFLESMSNYEKKSHEYNPTGRYEEIQKLPHEKSTELSNLFTKYNVAYKKFVEASEQASIKLRNLPNRGANFIMEIDK